MGVTFENELIAQCPSLRAFALSLSGNADRADDLVQETVLYALIGRHTFQEGTNLPAWLFTILRNIFRSQYRQRRREVEDVEGNYAKTLKIQPQQENHLHFEDFRVALSKLPQDQREALMLVGAAEFSQEEAAAICGCLVGTIKSRVGRARSKLHAILGFEPDEFYKKRRSVKKRVARVAWKPKVKMSSIEAGLMRKALRAARLAELAKREKKTLSKGKTQQVYEMHE